MSREILIFSLFSILANAVVGALWLPAWRIPSTLAFLSPWVARVSVLVPWLAGATACVGLLGVFTSVMIYVDTRRPFWGARLTAPKFFGTTFTLGVTAAAVVLSCVGADKSARAAIVMAMLARAGLLIWETAHDVPRASRTMLRLLPWRPEALMTLLALTMLACAVAMFASLPVATAASVVALGSTFAGSLIERYCFFATCPTPRMPGGVSV